MKLKPINDKIILALTVDEAVEYNEMVEKYYTLKDGKPSENDGMNKCPRCGREFDRDTHYCGLCGQWVAYKDYDYIPL